MIKLSVRLFVLLSAVAAAALICSQSFAAMPTLSEALHVRSVVSSTLVATAAAPPSLVKSVLNGQPIHVLYVTQADDTVLIRCYPGYQPTVTVRAMGSNPNGSGQKEGVMTCQPSTAPA